MVALFSPITILGLELKNRLVLPPLATSLAGEEGLVNKEHLFHYSRFPGLGMIIVEHSYVLPEGKSRAGQLGMDTQEHIPGFRELVEGIHGLGSRAGIQLSHAGSAGVRQRGPSPVPNPKNPESQPEALDSNEIDRIREAFAAAAERAVAAGFDFVELHGAHGYLLNQFLSPLTNQRTDAYGGSPENRLRFPLEVIGAVRRVLPASIPLLYRLGADDQLQGGITVQESPGIGKKMVEAGVDLLDISGGLMGYPTQVKEEGFFLYLSEAMKEVVEAPVLITGGFKTPEFANQVIQEERADLVGVGRTLLKDPQWGKKARERLTSP